MSTGELTCLHSVLPRLEAYHEVLHRKPLAEMDEDRAYNLVLTLTEDELAAERASNEVLFAKTPIA